MEEENEIEFLENLKSEREKLTDKIKAVDILISGYNLNWFQKLEFWQRLLIYYVGGFLTGMFAVWAW